MFNIRQSFKTGLSFGITSGVITTLGLTIGLYSSTHSRVVVIGGILVIAVADALSDALGIHISEESDKKSSPKEIWEATFSTFISKFIIALTFVVPILFFVLSTAIVVGVLWGLFLIGFFSFFLAKQKGEKPHKIILEHLVIAILVIIITYQIGEWISIFN